MPPASAGEINELNERALAKCQSLAKAPIKGNKITPDEAGGN